MVFGIGADKSKTTSSSQSQSSNWADAFSQAFGWNTSQGQTFIDPQQQAARQGLFGQVLASMNPGQARADATERLGAIMPQLNQAMTTLGSFDPASQIATQGAALQEGLGSLFQQEIMPGIQSDAIAAGGFGGGRQGVAEGVAAGQLGQSYTQGLADITAAANAQAMQAAQLQGILGQSIFDLGTAADTAGLDQLTSLAGILGPATVLSQQGSAGQTGSTSSSKSAGQSTSSSKAKSSSSGWKLGFGG
jgi:hypothetical protein